MQRDKFKMSEEELVAWANQTTAHPIGLALLGACMLGVLAVPRRFALTPFLTLACFAARQRVVVGGLDFDFIRILIIVGWIRVILRSEWISFRWNRLDTVFAAWCVVSSMAYVILHQTGDAITLQLGQLLTVAGGYYLFRMLVRDLDDLVIFGRASAVMALIVVPFFIFERMTARNLFSVFGGVPPLTQIRQGEIRAQGAFVHPILAGVFFSTLTPFFVAMWWRGFWDKALGVAGIVAALFVAIACASSTPIVGLMAVAFAMSLFVIRHHMRMVRWGILLTLVVLQLVKTRPVWHMFVYADIIGGSTGWHRYNLIDKAIRNFSEWMFVGTRSTAHWGPGLKDITNHFVLEGVRGGVLSMLLFIWLLVISFGAAGRLWRNVPPTKANLILAWAFGVTIFAHLVSFLAVSYFGQIVTLLTIHFAMAGSMISYVHDRAAAAAPARHPGASRTAPQSTIGRRHQYA